MLLRFKHCIKKKIPGPQVTECQRVRGFSPAMSRIKVRIIEKNPVLIIRFWRRQTRSLRTEEQSAKGQRPKALSSKFNLHTTPRGAGVAPVAVERAVVPAPPAAVPAHVTDTEVVARAVVDRATEEHILALPALGNEVLVGEQVIQHVGVHDGLVLQLLAELVSLQPLVFLLSIRDL